MTTKTTTKKASKGTENEAVSTETLAQEAPDVTETQPTTEPALESLPEYKGQFVAFLNTPNGYERINYCGFLSKVRELFTGAARVHDAQWGHLYDAETGQPQASFHYGELIYPKY